MSKDIPKEENKVDKKGQSTFFLEDIINKKQK